MTLQFHTYTWVRAIEFAVQKAIETGRRQRVLACPDGDPFGSCWVVEPV